MLIGCGQTFRGSEAIIDEANVLRKPYTYNRHFLLELAVSDALSVYDNCRIGNWTNCLIKVFSTTIHR